MRLAWPPVQFACTQAAARMEATLFSRSSTHDKANAMTTHDFIATRARDAALVASSQGAA